MSKVTISLNGRAFTIVCEEGQQAYLRELAGHLDGHVSDLTEKVGQIGELRLLLMASLIVADEMREAQDKLAASEAERRALRDELTHSEARVRAERAKAAEALDAAAVQLEALCDAAGAEFDDGVLEDGDRA